jgi:hypothetical protein
MLLLRHPSFVLVVILSPLHNRRLDTSVWVSNNTTKQDAANLKKISTVPLSQATESVDCCARGPSKRVMDRRTGTAHLPAGVKIRWRKETWLGTDLWTALKASRKASWTFTSRVGQGIAIEKYWGTLHASTWVNNPIRPNNRIDARVSEYMQR